VNGYASSEAAYFAFIENFYGCSLADLLKRYEHRFHAGTLHAGAADRELAELLNLDDLFALKSQQWDSIAVSDLPEGAPFCTSAGGDINQVGTPAFQPTGSYVQGGREIERIDPFRAAGLLGGSWNHLDAVELKNLLMYSEAAIIVDPLSDFGLATDVDFQLAMDEIDVHYLLPGVAHFIGGFRMQATLPLRERPSDFLTILGILEEYRSLFESGVVRLAPAPVLTDLYFGWDTEVRERIRFSIMALTGRRIFHEEYRVLSWALLRRAKAQVALLAKYGLRGGFFCAGELDRIACEALIWEMINIGSINPSFVLPVDGGESGRLQELLRVQLPGVGRVAVPEMSRLRTDEKIHEFRRAMRSALDASAEEPDLHAARRVCAEEVGGALRDLSATSFGARLKGASRGDLAGVAMGALAGWSVEGWRGSLAGVAASATLEAFATRPTRGEKALRHHYTQLSLV
jgi:hypothetical protein